MPFIETCTSHFTMLFLFFNKPRDMDFVIPSAIINSVRNFSMILSIFSAMDTVPSLLRNFLNKKQQFPVPNSLLLLIMFIVSYFSQREMVPYTCLIRDRTFICLSKYGVVYTKNLSHGFLQLATKIISLKTNFRKYRTSVLFEKREHKTLFIIK